MRRTPGGNCALVVLAAISLAACGGEGDGGPSEEDFLAQVDAICAETGSQVSALLDSEGTPDSNESLEAFLEKRLPISEQAQAEVTEVVPPDELADEYDAYLAEREKLIALLREQQAAAAAGDGRLAIEIDGRLSAQTEDLYEAAGAVGLQTCADRPRPGHEVEE